MTQEHPITPPPELVVEWSEQSCAEVNNTSNLFELESLKMAKAARWGWNQCMKLDHAWLEAKMQEAKDEELEACCEWLSTYGHTYEIGLRAARRPKPPSLKEQALTDFDRLMGELVGTERYKDWIASVRCALESLPE